MYLKKAGKFFGAVFILFLMAANTCTATVWQWSVNVKGVISSETNEHPTAFLWIPPNCKQVKGIIIGQHNMLEEGILEHPEFRKTLTDLGFAEIWITPSIDMVFDFNTTTPVCFEGMMKDLANISGYQELAFAPVVPIGHSAAASYPWNFGAWDPGRTLAILSVHGDAPLTTHTGSGRPNPDWGQRNIDGIPALMVMGEYEWGEQRILPAMQYKNDHPRAALAFLADAGHGHFDYSDELVRFLCLFLKKAAKYRLPVIMPLDGPAKLRSVNPAKGWLVDRWRLDKPLYAPAAAYKKYKGDRNEAFWVFDEEMAKATESYYTEARGKTRQYIGFEQHGDLLSGGNSFAGNKIEFIPHADGITFNLSATFKDSVQARTATDKHADGKINIMRICGPIEKLNDTTFRISFYRMGFNNGKRSGDIWLMASNSGDKIYKPAVQQANLKIPVRNQEGTDQQINFPPIADQSSKRKYIELKASSSAGEKVYYYVKEGPAEIDGDKLMFTKIPPRAKYPVKVTVVAWQWGRTIVPKVKSALPVTQSFDVNKPL